MKSQIKNIIIIFLSLTTILLSYIIFNYQINGRKTDKTKEITNNKVEQKKTDTVFITKEYLEEKNRQENTNTENKRISDSISALIIKNSELFQAYLSAKKQIQGADDIENKLNKLIEEQKNKLTNLVAELHQKEKDGKSSQEFIDFILSSPALKNTMYAGVNPAKNEKMQDVFLQSAEDFINNTDFNNSLVNLKIVQYFSPDNTKSEELRKIAQKGVLADSMFHSGKHEKAITLYNEISQAGYCIDYCNMQKAKIYDSQLIWQDRLNEILKRPTSIDRLYLEPAALVLKEKELYCLPEDIGKFINLRILDLSFNKLQTLPPDIEHLSKLEEIYLNDNEIYRMPPTFNKLISLQKIVLNGNSSLDIEFFIQQILVLSQFKELHLERNKIRVLPEKTGKLKNLQVLNLYKNDLQELPESISELVELKLLDIGSNPNLNTSEAMEIISKLPKLEKLNLFNTGLVDLPPKILQIKTLQEINLSHNKNLNIIETFEMLSQMPSINFIDLSENELAIFPEILPIPPNLKVLNLSGNKFERSQIKKIKKLFKSVQVIF